MDIINIAETQGESRGVAQLDLLNQNFTSEEITNNGLGRDDFLQILIAQLQNQDPTAPMEDKAFIAQMAQFSTLEQMTNLSQEFSELNDMLSTSHLVSLIGRNVSLSNGEQGQVTNINSGKYPQIMLNGRWHDYDTVENVGK